MQPTPAPAFAATQTAPLQSICILRLSAIGDVCHAVAVVQAIQRQYPQAQITWIIGKVEAMLLAGLPGVNFVIFDKKLGFKAYGELKRQLAGRQFDVLLHMQVALRANLASLVINARRKIGFDWQRAKELHALFMRERIAAPDPASSRHHVLDGFAGFARHLGVPFLTESTSQPSWQMPLEDSHRSWAKAQLQTGVRGHLVICPAASKAERNWLPARYAAIADYASAAGFAVYLCGGPTPMEQQLASEIKQAAQSELIDLVGKTNLKQLLALLEQASLVLAPDTGPAHMAVTVGTPVVGLYGHSNPDRTGPYLCRADVVEVYHAELQRQTGKTAAEVPWGTRVKGSHIMAHISVEQVWQKIQQVIAREAL